MYGYHHRRLTIAIEQSNPPRLSPRPTIPLLHRHNPILLPDLHGRAPLWPIIRMLKGILPWPGRESRGTEGGFRSKREPARLYMARRPRPSSSSLNSTERRRKPAVFLPRNPRQRATRLPPPPRRNRCQTWTRMVS